MGLCLLSCAPGREIPVAKVTIIFRFSVPVHGKVSIFIAEKAFSSSPLGAA